MKDTRDHGQIVFWDNVSYGFIRPDGGGQPGKASRSTGAAPIKRINFWREVVTPDGGVGSYCLHNGLLTVKTPNGSKTTQLGRMPPKVLAQIMLREANQPTPN